jgi:hypothetical protein
MVGWFDLLGALAAMGAEPNRTAARRRVGTPPVSGWSAWLGEPRNAVFTVLAAALVLGGGRRLLLGWRARNAVARLEGSDVTVEAIAQAAEHGRTGLMDLFRLLGTGESEAIRNAAGAAIAELWARDELVAEEEQALVRRGFAVSWRARRRYPRALSRAIPMGVAYGVPFLNEEGPGVRPSDLEWSHRILGTRRASLEAFSPWQAGPGRAQFLLVPDDFRENGPHRLVLQAKVRTKGLSGGWEFELPHMPFSFEFDPRLALEALFAQADDARADAFARSVRLEPAVASETGPSAFLELNAEMALRDPPAIVATTPLPADLAHAVTVEIDGIPGRFSSTELIVADQGRVPETTGASPLVRCPLGPIPGLPAGTVVRPGPTRVRAILTADPDRGWGDPDVRSIWPGTIETNWVDVEVVRK